MFQVPKNTTCKRLCDYFYRYEITTGYSDIAEEAKLECQNGNCFDVANPFAIHKYNISYLGCDIALQVCEPGYYCSVGEMLPCPPVSAFLIPSTFN